MEGLKTLSIGFGNRVVTSRVVAVLVPGSSPIRRLKAQAAESGRLANSTQGRKCRSMVLLDSGHLILSAVHPDTLCQRLETIACGERHDMGRLMACRVVAILEAASAAAGRLRGEAKKAGRLLDTTCGRRCRSLLVVDSGAIVLSSVHPDTLSERLESSPDRLPKSGILGGTDDHE